MSNDAAVGKSHGETPGEKDGTNISAFVSGALMIAISILSGAIGGVLYERTRPPQPQPKIMVLDMAKLLDPIAKDPSLNEYEKRRITEDLGTALQQAMREEADRGSVVLDASVVLKAPEESYVQP